MSLSGPGLPTCLLLPIRRPDRIDEVMQRLVRVETTIENNSSEGQRQQDSQPLPPDDNTEAP